MTAPALLDLFCCEGGAAKGYADAGWDVYGVDIKPQPRYPYWFHLGDALDVFDRMEAGELIEFVHPDGRRKLMGKNDFKARHASPPCQAYSVTKHTHSNEHPELVEPTRERFQRTAEPWVIENVPGAPLIDPLLLCGSMFGLRAIDVDGTELALRRHRLFESNVWLMGAGGCVHDGTQVAGCYGHGRSSRAKHDERRAGRGGYTPVKSVRVELMGMPWASQHGLSQAIPPAYTEHIGRQLLAEVTP